MTVPSNDPGRIITFYSYKGGTGRSMALANVAWILASNGYRVLVVDWDLEAPGLHRYFAPFMLDPDLVESDGIIEIVTNYVTALMTPVPSTDPPARPPTDLPFQPTADTSGAAATWYKPYADVLRYATSLNWRFGPCEGRQGWIDFIPAGRQGASYAARINAFNWQNFYDRLGGGGFIEALKGQMREEYDYTLIDSRTGVSDTSGVCTVQLPDVLAVCFTLNRQSIEGASAVAASVGVHRQNRAGAAPLRIFPIPMRVEKAEKEKLDLAHDDAAAQFAPVLSHVDESNWKQYWGDVEVLYEPFYAYEEVLSTFRDTLGQPTSMLASMERITAWLTDAQVTHLVPADEAERQRGLAKYARQSRKARAKGASSREPEFLFYISYARSDLDESLERFFTDLAGRVRVLGDMAPTAIPGFVDLDIAPGTDWHQELERALHVSRVLVPIYSPAYFASESAGREFQAFLMRAVDASRQTDILPVIWVQPTQLPPNAQHIAYNAVSLPEVYKNLGLRSLMRLRRYEGAYAEFLNGYARRLVEIASQVRPVSGAPTPLAQIPSAFADEKPRVRSTKNARTQQRLTTVFFASNRVLIGDPAAVASFGSKIRPPSVWSDMIYGTAFVDGVDIKTDQQGSITSIQDMNKGGFAANVAGDLSSAGRNLLVFIHGFNNTFEDAITRAAFNREFLAASGKPGTDTTVLAFSWPSLGKIVSFPVGDTDYFYDQKMATLSGVHLMSFFAQIEPLLRRARANGFRTYLLAHSMGNLALESAVENWFLHGMGNAKLFDVGFLTAGDCAYDTFAQPHLTGLDGLSLLSSRVSIYYSREDEVLDLSAVINGIQPLGHDGPKDRTDQTKFPPASYRMFDATDIKDYDRNFLTSHQYYCLSPTVRDAIAADLAPLLTA
jgi:esterase/lipase superfamily enzyme/MinD-like ATPase involved in chromosome partitioning or flagellar assembly